MPWDQASCFISHVVRGTRALCTLWVVTPQKAGALDYSHDYQLSKLLRISPHLLPTEVMSALDFDDRLVG